MRKFLLLVAACISSTITAQETNDWFSGLSEGAKDTLRLYVEEIAKSPATFSYNLKKLKEGTEERGYLHSYDFYNFERRITATYDEIWQKWEYQVKPEYEESLTDSLLSEYDDRLYGHFALIRHWGEDPANNYEKEKSNVKAHNEWVERGVYDQRKGFYPTYPTRDARRFERLMKGLAERDVQEYVRFFFNDFLDFGGGLDRTDAIEDWTPRAYNSRFVNALKYSVEVRYEFFGDRTLGLAKYYNNNEKAELVIDPDEWSKASKTKRLWLIYHELAHDIFNIDHIGKLEIMFPTVPSNPTVKELMDAREQLFTYIIGGFDVRDPDFIAKYLSEKMAKEYWDDVKAYERKVRREKYLDTFSVEDGYVLAWLFDKYKGKGVDNYIVINSYGDIIVDVPTSRCEFDWMEVQFDDVSFGLSGVWHSKEGRAFIIGGDDEQARLLSAIKSSKKMQIFIQTSCLDKYYEIDLTGSSAALKAIGL